MKIPLTNGLSALIDDDVFADMFSTHRPKWYAQFNPHTNSWYARTNIKIDGKMRGKLMHRMIMGAEAGQLVDHINHDTLDNRRSNLRLCNHRQNSFNRKMYTNNSTGFKGVSLRKDTGSFRAGVRVNGKMHWRGGFTDASIAAKAYNEMALELHGEHASLNTI